MITSRICKTIERVRREKGEGRTTGAALGPVGDWIGHRSCGSAPRGRRTMCRSPASSVGDVAPTYPVPVDGAEIGSGTDGAGRPRVADGPCAEAPHRSSGTWPRPTRCWWMARRLDRAPMVRVGPAWPTDHVPKPRIVRRGRGPDLPGAGGWRGDWIGHRVGRPHVADGPCLPKTTTACAGTPNTSGA